MESFLNIASRIECRGSAIAYGCYDLAELFGTNITRREDTGDGCGHFLIGMDKPLCVTLYLDGHEMRVGLNSNENEDTAY